LLLRLNFKVLTQPAEDVTALIGGDRAPLLTLATALTGSQLAPDSLELFGPGAPSLDESGWRLAVRLTGSEQGIARKRGDLTALCTAAGLTAVWTEGQPMVTAWQRCADFLAPGTTPGDEAFLRLSVPPSGVGDAVVRLERAARGANLAVRLAAHAGNGVVFARLRGGHVNDALPALFQGLAAPNNGVTLLAAPAAVREHLDVWGPLPAGFPLMERIKAQFDPRRTLNPGRFLGRL
jgi:glycolate oxidase FAD binding subunit